MLWSTKHQKIVLVELTLPWEEGCEEAHERKASKYQPLNQELRDERLAGMVVPGGDWVQELPSQVTLAFDVSSRLG